MDEIESMLLLSVKDGDIVLFKGEWHDPSQMKAIGNELDQWRERTGNQNVLFIFCGPETSFEVLRGTGDA